MSTGIHVLLIDSTTGIALQSAQRFPSVVLTKLDHTAFLALALKNDVQGHAEGRNIRRRSGADHCQGHRHRFARKVSKPGEPRTTA